MIDLTMFLAFQFPFHYNFDSVFFGSNFSATMLLFTDIFWELEIEPMRFVCNCFTMINTNQMQFSNRSISYEKCKRQTLNAWTEQNQSERKTLNVQWKIRHCVTVYPLCRSNCIASFAITAKWKRKEEYKRLLTIK